VKKLERLKYEFCTNRYFYKQQPLSLKYERDEKMRYNKILFSHKINNMAFRGVIIER